MTALVVISVILIVLLIAGLAFFLAWLGILLGRVADNLDEVGQSVQTAVGHAELIRPGLEHVNRSGKIVAGALPLLYGHAERIAAKNAPAATEAANGTGTAVSGRRRSRLTEAVGLRRD